MKTRPANECLCGCPTLGGRKCWFCPHKQKDKKSSDKKEKSSKNKKRPAVEETESKEAKKGKLQDKCVWEGPPDDKGIDWPPGWVKRKFERSTGATQGRLDNYWYSPIHGYKLRSILEVKRFLAALEKNGDETEACKKRGARA